jgi:hypothetical protein
LNSIIGDIFLFFSFLRNYMMFSALREFFGDWISASPKKPGSTRARLSLESLEHRALLSGGPLTTIVDTTPDVVGGPGGPNSGGPSQGILTGPGYPIASSGGPTRTSSQTLTTQGQSSTQIPLTGANGGNGPSLASVAVCLGTGGPGNTSGL